MRIGGGQVFVSTHSPDFLNAARLDEVFWLQKKGGYTKIRRASEDEQVAAYMQGRRPDGLPVETGLFQGSRSGGMNLVFFLERNR